MVVMHCVIPLGIDQLDACLELDRLALSGLWSEQQWTQELTGAGHLCLGIFDSSALVALACGCLVVDEFQLTAVAVHPQHRRQGLAKLVLSKLLEKAELAGAIEANLDVASTNSAAKALYQSCDFTTTGSRSRYYKDGSDALIQWRALSQNAQSR
ncbi:MAG: GNAT family N-acetyltransferase [Prochlorococcus sp.]|jgi:ribosomal-protein-alanine N-acetyltransferase|nr:GNAT family N-acetyltransferase [Prochlorococcus sp.]CAI8158682.1 MAG: Ribosomal-protein-alanine acetyltransferase [Prochlorococcus marinus str. MIT 9215]